MDVADAADESQGDMPKFLRYPGDTVVNNFPFPVNLFDRSFRGTATKWATPHNKNSEGDRVGVSLTRFPFFHKSARSNPWSRMGNHA